MAVNGWIIEKTVDLANPPKYFRQESPYEIVYVGDNYAVEWRVDVLKDGASASLGGTVMAYVKRPDGSIVATMSTVTNNRCEVSLGSTDFGVPGYVYAVLRYTDSYTHATVTLDAVAFVVHSIDGSIIDKDSVLPETIDQLLSEIETMREATEAAQAAAECIADDYSASSTYAVGDYVIHNGGLYRCTTAITTAETWTAAHWTQVVFGDEVSDLKSAFDASVFDGENMYNTLVFWTNNHQVINNNDGTYTVNPGDYGRSTFGGLVALQPGCYKLYGVPQGYSYLSPANNFADAVFTNDGSTPKIIVIESPTSLYLGYRIGTPPSTSFTIRPFLYNTKINNIKSALAEDDVLFKLHAEEIDGTTQTVVYENGQIKRILHKYSNNDQLVRTDAYTFGDTQIVETRTLATGDTMTITTNLSTLQTTVQTILVPAV